MAEPKAAPKAGTQSTEPPKNQPGPDSEPGTWEKHPDVAKYEAELAEIEEPA